MRRLPLIFLIHCSSAIFGTAIPPYSIAGPLYSQSHHRPELEPPDIQRPRTSNLSQEEGGSMKAQAAERAAHYDGPQSLTKTAEEEAAAVAGLIPEYLGDAEQRSAAMDSLISSPISAQHPGVPTAAQAQAYKMMSSSFVEWSVASIHAGVIGPAGWLCYTARSTLMRNWFSGIIPTTTIFFGIFKLLLDTSLSATIALLLSKAVAIPAGTFLFFRPGVGWAATLFTTSIILAQLLSLPSATTSPSTKQTTVPLGNNTIPVSSGPGILPSILIFVSLSFLEILLPDAGQAIITSVASGYCFISGLAFLALFFGISNGAPLDPTLLWTADLQMLKQTASVSFSLLGIWLAMIMSGVFVQILRSKQGFTVGFTPLSVQIMGEKKRV